MLTKQMPLSIAKDENLNQAVDAITALIRPEMIICYGIRTKCFEAWSCFLPSQKSCTARTYDLLIVTQDNSKKKDHEVQDSIENFNTKDFAITAVIHRLMAVEEGLRTGSFFFTRTFHEGVLLYSASQIPLRVPKIADRTSEIEAQWDKWFGLAKKFSKGASYYLSDRCYDLAVFMLHQSVEHTAIALIRIHMGYRPSTHNLKRLLALVENFAPFSFVVFSKTSKEEAELFDILARAYSDVRYKEGYTVSGETVIMLADRISSLHKLSEELFEKLLKKESVSQAISSFENQSL